ncbi:MAG: DUF3108 domain-containing protein [Flavobacteriaceae bacterium]|nr:DUF3108 domain-containing protein [Flavobacteriaceae bacterium]
MKKRTLLFIAICLTLSSFSQEKTTVFKKGEWLRFKMSYSGFLKAGNATLTVKEDTLNGKEVFHVVGKGWTTGIIKWFFKVDDTYQSYFDKTTLKPYLFKRNIYEGGYRINREVQFNYTTNTALVKDFKLNTTNTVSIGNIQDMMSSFYYLRNHDASQLKDGDEIALDMFLDSQIYPFKLRLLGRETLKTRFGKIKTLRFRPLVQAGRVFKENESVTIWITEDSNKIPIKLVAKLAVGSLRAELDAYKGLANSFEIIYD